MTQQTFRFGILGAGVVAQRFAREVTGIAEIYAVASRDGRRAKAFADAYGVTKSYASYAELLADEKVDAVYVATPAPLHRDHCLMCIEAGRPVLCEKPFTMNAGEAREIAAAARTANLFCMEAMWMRFNPLIVRTSRLVADGAIGDVKVMRAEIGFRQRPSKEVRLMNPEVGGGGLLDLGIYGLSLAHFLFGTPDEILARGKFHDTGVDEVVSILMDYPGHLVSLTASVATTPTNTALIMGTTGHIEIGAPFFNPGRIRITEVRESGPPPARPGLKRRIFDKLPFAKRLEQSSIMPVLLGRGGNVEFLISAGFRYQAEEVIRCVRAQKYESDIMSLSDSIDVMDMVDQIRGQITGA